MSEVAKLRQQFEIANRARPVTGSTINLEIGGGGTKTQYASTPNINSRNVRPDSPPTTPNRNHNFVSISTINIGGPSEERRSSMDSNSGLTPKNTPNKSLNDSSLWSNSPEESPITRTVATPRTNGGYRPPASATSTPYFPSLARVKATPLSDFSSPGGSPYYDSSANSKLRSYSVDSHSNVSIPVLDLDSSTPAFLPRDPSRETDDEDNKRREYNSRVFLEKRRAFSDVKDEFPRNIYASQPAINSSGASNRWASPSTPPSSNSYSTDRKSSFGSTGEIRSPPSSSSHQSYSMRPTNTQPFTATVPPSQVKHEADAPFSQIPNPQTHNFDTPASTPKIVKSTQTELLAAPGGNTTLVDSSNYKANVQLLIAELDAAKDLNKKLSVELAKVERDHQSLKIQQEIQNDQMEASVATRVADAVRHMSQKTSPASSVNVSRSSTFRSKAEMRSQSCQTVESDSNDRYMIKDDNISGLLSQLEKQDSLSPAEIATNCRLMIDYVQQKGCELNEKDQLILQPNLADTLKRLELENEKLQEELDSANKSLSDLRNSLEQTKRERDELSRKSGHLEISLEQKQRENAFLADEKEELEREKRVFIREKQEVASKLDKINSERQNERAEFNQRITQLSQRIDDEEKRRKNEEKEYEEKLRAASPQPKDRKGNFVDQAAYAELETEKRELMIQLDREQNEKQELFLQMNTLMTQLAESERSNNTTDELRYLREEKDRLAVELKELYANVQEIQDHGEKRTKELEKSLQSGTAEKEKLEERLKKLETEVTIAEESRSEANKLRQQVDLLKHQLELVSDYETVKHELERVRDELRILREKEEDNLKHKDDGTEKVEQLADELQNAVESRERADSELEKVKSRLEQQETKWEHDLYDLRAKYREADEERFKLKEELMNAKRQTDEEKKKREEIEADLKNKEEEMAKEKERVKSSIPAPVLPPQNGSDSGAEKAALEGKVKELSGENKQLKSDLDKQQRLVSVLRRKLNTTVR